MSSKVSKESKFGVVPPDLLEVLTVLSGEPRVRVVGLHCHLGSTIEDVSVYSELLTRYE